MVPLSPPSPTPPRAPRFGTLRRASHRLLSVLIGNPRDFSLDHRLFNSVSLLNAVTNFGGIPSLFLLKDSGLLVALNLGIGIVFLAFYWVARWGGKFRPLYWPFVLTIVAFLFTNMLFNAGAAGGAAWYLVPALVIATALSARTRDAVISAAFFASATVGILLVEQKWPSLIRPYSSPQDRLADLAGNMLFAQFFTGGLVLLLAKTLNAERHRSEALLLNVLPKEIAEELKRESKVAPRHYDSATVLFSDFVGFTQISESLTPTQLIERLDQAFQEFDLLAQAQGIEKIKTIGDAYLAVGGIPRPNSTHAIDCALVALEMARGTERLRAEHEQAGQPAWSIRLGLHTGPLVAGVIGTEKFAYDVWGDTVNTANRIESSGIPGQINLSEATHTLVSEFFVCEPRGRIAAKGKGELNMYLLKGIRPELTNDGVRPNPRFQALYARLTEPNPTPIPTT